jgi:hypothetical protein
MPQHIYVVVTCKTPRCANVCALKHLGPDIGAVEIGEMTPTGAWYACAQCQQQHRYEMEEFRIGRFLFPPPPGWSNGWE